MATKSYIPNPRYILSLRESGYNNYQAIEDIVDNSIDALKDTEDAIITINTIFTKENVLDGGKIIISDNGCGMTSDTLHEALRLGSETNKSKETDDLGRFGVGLKASATSIGKVFKIITKHKDDDYYTAIYDIEIGIKKNTWEFPEIRKSTNEEIEILKMYGVKKTGTYLEITHLDGLSNKNNSQFSAIVIKRIGEIFRYKLSRRNNDGKIKIYVNTKLIEPIDPMCRNFKDTFLLNESGDNKYTIQSDDNKIIEFFVDFYHISDEGKDLKGDKNNGNPIEPNQANQGIYVVRNDRQIMRSTTLQLMVKHPSCNNFRVELRYDSKYDNYFRIDVKKIVINPIQAILDKIKNDMDTYRIQSQNKYFSNKKRKDKSKNLEDVNKLMEDNFNKNPFHPIPPKKENNEPKTDNVLKKENKPKTDDLLKKEEPKNDTKQHLPFNWTTHEGDSFAPFFEKRRVGQRKYEISLNISHIYYDKFTSLDDSGKIVLCSMLYSFILAEDEVLYNIIDEIKNNGVELDHEDKEIIIDKLNREWSIILKDTLYR